MTTEYSPGPWLARDNYFLLIDDSSGNLVATVKGANSAEQEANAALIASSPDLLCSLKELAELIEDEFGDCYDDNSTPRAQDAGRKLRRARANIAKAEGGTQ